MSDTSEPETFSAADIETIYSLIREDLSAEFGVPLDETATQGYRPDNPLDRDTLGQWQQHLLDLGYLEESIATADRYTREVIQAVEAFCADDPSLEPLRPALAEAGIRLSSTLDVPLESVGAEELDRLEQWTSFDGVQMGVSRPAAGESSLASRVLHFRLKTLGLYRKAVDRPVDDRTSAALQSLERTIGPVSDTENLIDLLGDPDRLGEKYIARLGGEPLVFRHPTDCSDTGTDHPELAIVNGQFLSGDREWSVLQHRDPETFRRLQDQLEERGSPRARRMGVENRFGLQLIQLQLWKHGFYEGRVDGWWGARSFEALKEALAFEGIAVEKVMRSLGEGYVALNFPMLHEQLFAQLDRAESSLEVCRAYIMQESVYLGDQEKEHAGLFRRILSGVRDSFQQVIAAGRRIYRGAKTLVKSAANALLKGFNWIRGELDRLAAPVANFLRLCRTTIRDGIRSAAQSVQKFVHFVQGKPLAVADGTACITVRFSRDSDATVFASEEASVQLFDRHRRMLRALARGMDRSLVVAARIIRYFFRIAAGPPGWLRIAFEIGTIVRNSMRAPLPVDR